MLNWHLGAFGWSQQLPTANSQQLAEHEVQGDINANGQFGKFLKIKNAQVNSTAGLEDNRRQLKWIMAESYPW